MHDPCSEGGGLEKMLHISPRRVISGTDLIAFQPVDLSKVYRPLSEQVYNSEDCFLCPEQIMTDAYGTVTLLIKSVHHQYQNGWHSMLYSEMLVPNLLQEELPSECCTCEHMDSLQHWIQWPGT